MVNCSSKRAGLANHQTNLWLRLFLLSTVLVLFSAAFPFSLSADSHITACVAPSDGPQAQKTKSNAKLPCLCTGTDGKRLKDQTDSTTNDPIGCTPASITTDKAATTFTNSGLFTIIQNFARLLGFFIVAFAIFRVVQRVTSQGGEGGLMQSMRMLVPAVVVAALLMQLTIITTIVGFAVGVVTGIIDLFGDAVGA